MNNSLSVQNIRTGLRFNRNNATDLWLMDIVWNLERSNRRNCNKSPENFAKQGIRRVDREMDIRDERRLASSLTKRGGDLQYTRCLVSSEIYNKPQSWYGSHSSSSNAREVGKFQKRRVLQVYKFLRDKAAKVELGRSYIIKKTCNQTISRLDPSR